MAVVMDLQFDSITKAQDWWSNYDSSPSVAAPVKFVSDGTDSRVEIDIVARNANIPVIAGAFSVKSNTPYGDEFAAQTVLDGKEAMFNVGDVVNCFDPDPAIRGRYIVQTNGGVKSFARQSSVTTDKLWPDNNHPERLLELILCSWIATTPPHPGSGPQAGWVSPPGNDWSQAKITFDMRCQGLYLGKWAKIAQHVQGEIPSLTALLPPGSHATPNFLFTRQLISDQLGFGNAGWGHPNKVEFVYDSGRRPVLLNYTTNDEDWQALGSVTRGFSYYHYVVTPIAELLTNLIGNSYMMAIHDAPQDDADVFAPVPHGISEQERISGKLMIYGIKVEVPD